MKINHSRFKTTYDSIHLKGRKTAKRRQYLVDFITKYPFISEYLRPSTSSEIPYSRRHCELVCDGFLGFRKHSIARFIYTYSLYCENVALVPEKKVCHSGYSNGLDATMANVAVSANIQGRARYDAFLKLYIKRLSLLHTLFLFQIYSRCCAHDSNLVYSFIKYISQSLSKEVTDISNLDVVSEIAVNHLGGGKARKSILNKWLLYNFIFQEKSALLKYRNDVYSTNAYSDRPSEGCYNIFARLDRENRPTDTNEKERRDANSHEKKTNSEISRDCSSLEEYISYRGGLTYLTPDSKYAGISVIGKENALSGTLMCIVLYGIITRKHWEHGYPFDSWINTYFILNCHLYHPLLTKLFAAKILPLYNATHKKKVTIVPLISALKEDLYKCSETEVYHSDLWIYSYYSVKTSHYDLVFNHLEFCFYDLIKVFDAIKKLVCNSDYTDAPQVVQLLIHRITVSINQLPFNRNFLHLLTERYERSNSNMLIPLIESLEVLVLKNVDDVTPTDIANVLQASNMNNLYNEQLVDVLCDKLITCDLHDLALAKLVHIIGVLGKTRIKPKGDTFLDRLSAFIMKDKTKLGSITDIQCYTLLTAMYNLRYTNTVLFSEFVKRYKKSIAAPANKNLNTLVILFCALAKVHKFENLSDVLKSYRVFSSGITTMTNMTTLKLIHLLTQFLDSIPAKPNELEQMASFVLKTNVLFESCLNNICNRLHTFSLTQIVALLDALHKAKRRKNELLAPLVATITTTGPYKPSDERLQMPCKRDVTPKTSLYAYVSLPLCPFDAEECNSRLGKLELRHLASICVSIYSLNFWTPSSIHLLLHIKEIIEPQLHDMKADHIVDIALSFTDFHFADYQLASCDYVKQVYKIDNIKRKRELTTDLLRKIKYIVAFNKKSFERVKSKWFAENISIIDSYYSLDLFDRFKNVLVRSQWKEELFLACIEGLQRHEAFVSSSPTTLKRVKILYDLLKLDIYLPDYPYKVPEHFDINKLSGKQSFQILEHAIEKFGYISAALPQKVLESQARIYRISRTESYNNFFNNSISSGDEYQISGNNSSCEDDEEAQQIDGGSEHENIQKNAHFVDHKPLLVKNYSTKPTTDQETWYVNHKGSGMILEINAVNDIWIYVDPVIAGFRTNILILRDGLHKIPHLE